MKNEILLLDEKSVNDFWRLRIELFQELEEVSKGADCTQLESAT